MYSTWKFTAFGMKPISTYPALGIPTTWLEPTYDKVRLDMILE